MRRSSSGRRSSDPAKRNQPLRHRTAQRAPEEMILTAPLLAQFPWLFHGFSTRRGGVSSFDSPGDSPGDSVHSSGDGADLNLGHLPWDNRKNVLENRRRLLARLAAKDMQLVLQRQIHSDLIRVLDDVGTGLQACPACPERLAPSGLPRAKSRGVEGSEVEGNAYPTSAKISGRLFAINGMIPCRVGEARGAKKAPEEAYGTNTTNDH